MPNILKWSLIESAKISVFSPLIFLRDAFNPFTFREIAYIQPTPSIFSFFLVPVWIGGLEFEVTRGVLKILTQTCVLLFLYLRRSKLNSLLALSVLLSMMISTGIVSMIIFLSLSLFKAASEAIGIASHWLPSLCLLGWLLAERLICSLSSFRACSSCWPCICCAILWSSVGSSLDPQTSNVEPGLLYTCSYRNNLF